MVALLTFQVTVPKGYQPEDVVAEMEHYLRVDDDIVSLLETSFLEGVSFADCGRACGIVFVYGKTDPTQH